MASSSSTLKLTTKPGQENYLIGRNILNQIALAEHTLKNKAIPTQDEEVKKFQNQIEEINNAKSEALKHFRIAAAKGHLNATFEIGYLLFHLLSYRDNNSERPALELKNAEEAFSCLNRAAAQGHLEAQALLGNEYYTSGRRFRTIYPLEEKQSFPWLQSCAQAEINPELKKEANHNLLAKERYDLLTTAKLTFIEYYFKKLTSPLEVKKQILFLYADYVEITNCDPMPEHFDLFYEQCNHLLSNQEKFNLGIIFAERKSMAAGKIHQSISTDFNQLVDTSATQELFKNHFDKYSDQVEPILNTLTVSNKNKMIEAYPHIQSFNVEIFRRMPSIIQIRGLVDLIASFAAPYDYPVATGYAVMFPEKKQLELFCETTKKCFGCPEAKLFLFNEADKIIDKIKAIELLSMQPFHRSIYASTYEDLRKEIGSSCFYITTSYLADTDEATKNKFLKFIISIDHALNLNIRDPKDYYKVLCPKPTVTPGAREFKLKYLPLPSLRFSFSNTSNSSSSSRTNLLRTSTPSSVLRKN